MTEYLKPLDADALRPYIELAMARNTVCDAIVPVIRKICEDYPHKSLNVRFAEHFRVFVKLWAENNKPKLERAKLMLHYMKANPVGDGDYAVAVQFSNTVSYDHGVRAFYEFANGHELFLHIAFANKRITPDAFAAVEQQQLRAVRDNETLQHYVSSGRLDAAVREYNNALAALKTACGGDMQTYPLSQFFRSHQL